MGGPVGGPVGGIDGPFDVGYWLGYIGLGPDGPLRGPEFALYGPVGGP